MKTKQMLVPITITTAARLTLAFGVLGPAVLLVGAGQAHLRIVQLGETVDPAAGLALLAFTVFLASHRLRRVDLVHDFMALRESEIGALLAQVGGRLGLRLRSSLERSRTFVRELGDMTDPRLPLSQ